MGNDARAFLPEGMKERYHVLKTFRLSSLFLLTLVRFSEANGDQEPVSDLEAS